MKTLDGKKEDEERSTLESSGQYPKSLPKSVLGTLESLIVSDLTSLISHFFTFSPCDLELHWQTRLCNEARESLDCSYLNRFCLTFPYHR